MTFVSDYFFSKKEQEDLEQTTYQVDPAIDTLISYSEDQKRRKCRKLFYMDRRIDYFSEILIVNLPNADAITRRLKKLVNMITKLSNENSSKKED
jgi:hypothetical protein